MQGMWGADQPFYKLRSLSHYIYLIQVLDLGRLKKFKSPSICAHKEHSVRGSGSISPRGPALPYWCKLQLTSRNAFEAALLSRRPVFSQTRLSCPPNAPHLHKPWTPVFWCLFSLELAQLVSTALQDPAKSFIQRNQIGTGSTKTSELPRWRCLPERVCDLLLIIFP